jgi:3D (Asp-Asp-Asp) domain-containing protein
MLRRVSAMLLRQDSLFAKNVWLVLIAGLLVGVLVDASGCASTEEAAAVPQPAPLPRPRMVAPAPKPLTAIPQPLPQPAAQSLDLPSVAAAEDLPAKPANPKPASVRTIAMNVTAYCPCKQCCGRRAHGVTASGKSVRANGGTFVAADTKVLPFHTKLIIPGYNSNRPTPVLDRGGDIVGNRLDVFFRSHADAERWGRRTVNVTVLK